MIHGDFRERDRADAFGRPRLDSSASSVCELVGTPTKLDRLKDKLGMGSKTVAKQVAEQQKAREKAEKEARKEAEKEASKYVNREEGPPLRDRKVECCGFEIPSPGAAAYRTGDMAVALVAEAVAIPFQFLRCLIRTFVGPKEDWKNLCLMITRFIGLCYGLVVPFSLDDKYKGTEESWKDLCSVFTGNYEHIEIVPREKDLPPPALSRATSSVSAVRSEQDDDDCCGNWR